MTGGQYRDLIAAYLARNFEKRGLRVFTEVRIGKSTIGKERQIDVFAYDESTKRALAFECKTQNTNGTADEKLVYAIQDIEAMRMPGAIIYAGEGFSPGVVQMLRASPSALYCLPDPETLSSGGTETRELDVFLAQELGWWDIVTVSYEHRRFDWRKYTTENA